MLAFLILSTTLLPAGEAGALLGVRAVEEEMPYVLEDGAPLTLLLSKSVYPAEDLHLDALVWLQGAERTRQRGDLRIDLLDDNGRTIREETLTGPLPEQIFFSYLFPDDLPGRAASLRVAHVAGGQVLATQTHPFAVREAKDVARAGRIALGIPNDRGVTLEGAPMTVGVPFPQGALADPANVRLLDASGAEIPLQALVTSRWSRFGFVRWLQCDFTVDLDGAARELVLEYGPDVSRNGPQTPMRAVLADDGDGLAVLETGRLRIGPEGIALRKGDDYTPILGPETLSGAYVEHENGKRFVLPADTPWQLEEHGPEKVLLKRTGWYELPGSDERFCQFVVRYHVFRDSPLVRIEHTWIYTGYPYEHLYTWETRQKLKLGKKVDPDRIRDMGWAFDLADGLAPQGFLTDSDAGWREGQYILQHDYDKSEVVAGGEVVHEGARAPGIAAASGNGTRFVFGLRNFWEDFPNELEFADGALLYHQWPRHGRPAGTHPLEAAQGLRLWFAHEGEVLDLAVPEAFTESEEFQKANRRGYHQQGRRQAANAQGIAKTAEMWLLFTDEDVSADASAEALAGLDDGTLRAVVDPAWVADSGAFHEIHEYDPETYPEAEKVFDLHASAPLRWIERTRLYGKWIWGDMFWGARLRERDFASSWGLYRGFRKSHQGWPYSWLSYARSGNPEYLRLADAAARHMADVAFCHYSDERVPPWRGGSDEEHPVRPRWRGFYNRVHIPWASYSADATSRDYTDETDYLWHSFYLTGYRRALDVARDWIYLVKNEGASRWGGSKTVFTGPFEGFEARRISVTMLQAFVDTYQSTFDPWFLAAAHQTARTEMKYFRERNWKGHFWNPGPREFLRFTGNADFRKFYLSYADHLAIQQFFGTWGRAAVHMKPLAYAYYLTGNEFYLRRLEGWLDYTRLATADEQMVPDYFRGCIVKEQSSMNADPMYTGFFLQQFPYALEAIDRAGKRVPPAPNGFLQSTLDVSDEPVDGAWEYRFDLLLKKDAGEPMPLCIHINAEYWDPIDDLDETIAWTLNGPDGEVSLEGTAYYQTNDNRPSDLDPDKNRKSRPTLSANTPAGLYRLRIKARNRYSPKSNTRRRPAIHLPVSGPGIEEVFLLPEGTDRIPAHPYWMANIYCIRVPEGTESFWVEFDLGPVPKHNRKRRDLVRLLVLNDRDEIVWKEQFSHADRKDTKSIRADITVPEGRDGKIWRIVVCGNNEVIRLDPALPRFVSISPARWFDPENVGD